MKWAQIQIPNRIAALLIVAGGVVFTLGLMYFSRVETVRVEVDSADAANRLVQVSTLNGVSCSGFRVGPHHVMTAAHCFESGPAEVPGAVAVTLSPHTTADRQWVSGPICSPSRIDIPERFDPEHYQSEWDFALLSLDDCALGNASNSFFDLTEYAHTPLVSLGYPGDTPMYSIWESQGSEVRTWVDFVRPSPDPVITTNLKAVEGNSGGVVFNGDNPDQAVGITILTRSDGASQVLTFDEERLSMISSWISS